MRCPWTGSPPICAPAEAANAVQALVSRLRAALGRDIVEHGPTGYRLTVPSGEIDAWAFEQAVTAARARLAEPDHAAAADMFRGALRMWRGPALADVAGGRVTMIIEGYSGIIGAVNAALLAPSCGLFPRTSLLCHLS